MTPTFRVLAVAVTSVWWTGQVQAEDFLDAGQAAPADAEAALLAELTPGSLVGRRGGKEAALQRFSALESSLRRTYNSLPKSAEGNLEKDSVRYALHRYFLHNHGWYVKGLEPSSAGRAREDWVPDHLESFMEARFGHRGLALHELAALAAAIEDMVLKEALDRLEGVFKAEELDMSSPLSAEDAHLVMESYTMVFLKGGNISLVSHDQAEKRLALFKRRYADWQVTGLWAAELLANMTQGADVVDFTLMAEVAEALGENFGRFNDGECAALKNELLSFEDIKPGRVTLSEFYRHTRYSHWKFNEKVDYLRKLGALDESDPLVPRVIVPNYVGSRPQCLESSHFYAVCCRNECEEMMGAIENEVAGPTAAPQRLASIVVEAAGSMMPTGLSSSLRSRLDEVADTNGGVVPIHGRLFAQWLHHAFPRECPYPHESGTTSPQTGDEWMTQTGETSEKLSDDELQCFIGEVTNGCGSMPDWVTATGADVPDSADLPWNSVEELFSVQPGKAPSKLRHVSRLLRTVALAAVALGLGLLSYLASPRGLHAGHGVLKLVKNQWDTLSWWVTLMLYAIPLVIISVDFAADEPTGPASFLGSVANELAICVLCWGLAIALCFAARGGLKHAIAKASAVSWCLDASDRLV